ncbi:hydroxypyruvate isomerase family protein [Actinomycetes bacterium M1A6_2h]
MTQYSYTANCSILFPDVPLLERAQTAKQHGFDRVEFWWPFATPTPADRDVDAFVASIQDAGVALTGLNFAAGDMPAGDRGLLSDPGQVTAFRDNVDVVVGIGERLGTTGFNALYGNRIEGLEPREQDEIATENLAAAGKAVGAIGAVVLIEPTSGVPAYPLKTAADAIDVIDAVAARGVDTLRLLADLYHLDVNGDDIAKALDAYSAVIGHVQIADSPGRGEPGTGALDLDRYLTQLTSNGYDGLVGIEYKPTRRDTFDWLSPTHSK